MLTPDSSRFWPADEYRIGISPPSFDKQFVRNWLETQPWDKKASSAQAARRGAREHECKIPGSAASADELTRARADRVSTPRSPAMMSQLDEAVAVLKRGGLVAFPTETVYGLGADAGNPAAIAKLYAAKGRPADHPVIVHIAGMAQLNEWAREITPVARRLAERFWPGPLTLILKRAPGVSDALTGGQDTVGLRIPSHPVAHALLEKFGGGVAAPSANRFGRVSATLAEHVRREFGDAVDSCSTAANATSASSRRSSMQPAPRRSCCGRVISPRATLNRRRASLWRR